MATYHNAQQQCLHTNDMYGTIGTVHDMYIAELPTSVPKQAYRENSETSQKPVKLMKPSPGNDTSISSKYGQNMLRFR